LDQVISLVSVERIPNDELIWREARADNFEPEIAQMTTAPRGGDTCLKLDNNLTVDATQELCCRIAVDSRRTARLGPASSGGVSLIDKKAGRGAYDTRCIVCVARRIRIRQHVREAN
jgi:hypothetical protein